MTLVDLIKGLKEEFKTKGDRELPPYVTVENILDGTLAPAPQVPAADQIGPVRPSRGRAPATPAGEPD